MRERWLQVLLAFGALFFVLISPAYGEEGVNLPENSDASSLKKETVSTKNDATPEEVKKILELRELLDMMELLQDLDVLTGLEEKK